MPAKTEMSGRRRSESSASEVQADRIRHQRSCRDSLVALQDRHTQITVDRVLRARGKMMKNTGPPTAW